MKVNAPEKIYIDGYSSFACEPNDGNIEYTRTDYAEKVFIIKTQKWLAEIHRVCDITDEDGYRIDLRELQARFEQYMKGK